MKKIIPLLTLTGLTCMLTGCNFTVADTTGKIMHETPVQKETTSNLTLNKMDKYNLIVDFPQNETSVSAENEEITEENVEPEQQTEQENEQNTEQETLYSLQNDVEDGCNKFCTLKQGLNNAILETQELLDKLKNSEIELSKEDKQAITQKAMELKSLTRQLTSAITALTFNLSELNDLSKLDNADFDALTMKYLIVLDNLVNGNEMLESGLQTLNSFNSIFNNGKLPPDAQGRFQYGYQRYGMPPVYKDYYIKNGQFEENKDTTGNNQESEVANSPEDENSPFKHNIDTYGNTNQNIDSFFNTALFDNEFMYGNNGFGYGGINPYMNYSRQMNNQNFNQNNTTNGTDTNINTQQVEKKKRFKFNKNIDTYRDESTKSPKEKFDAIKTSVSNFFNKFSFNKAKDVDNPVYMFEQEKLKKEPQN